MILLYLFHMIDNTIHNQKHKYTNETYMYTRLKFVACIQCQIKYHTPKTRVFDSSTANDVRNLPHKSVLDYSAGNSITELRS